MSKSNQNQTRDYNQFVKSRHPKTPLLKNCTAAFVVGGSICALAQGIQNFYITVFNFSEQQASNPTVATVIFIAGLLTALGFFDRIAKFAGAGTAVPVTGFANSVVSSALEFKKEGFVLGVGSKMFSLAGSVIVFGVVTAFVIGIISALV